AVQQVDIFQLERFVAAVRDRVPEMKTAVLRSGIEPIECADIFPRVAARELLRRYAIDVESHPADCAAGWNGPSGHFEPVALAADAFDAPWLRTTESTQFVPITVVGRQIATLKQRALRQQCDIRPVGVFALFERNFDLRQAVMTQARKN